MAETFNKYYNSCCCIHSKLYCTGYYWGVCIHRSISNASNADKSMHEMNYFMGTGKINNIQKNQLKIAWELFILPFFYAFVGIWHFMKMVIYKLRVNLMYVIYTYFDENQQRIFRNVSYVLRTNLFIEKSINRNIGQMESKACTHFTFLCQTAKINKMAKHSWNKIHAHMHVYT